MKNMRCVICKKTIGKLECKAYVVVYRGDKPHKVYACAKCNESAFDDWIDALAVDDNGNPVGKIPAAL